MPHFATYETEPQQSADWVIRDRRLATTQNISLITRDVNAGFLAAQMATRLGTLLEPPTPHHGALFLLERCQSYRRRQRQCSNRLYPENEGRTSLQQRR
jgi:hypothetical protein